MVGGYGLKIKLFNYAVCLKQLLNANAGSIANSPLGVQNPAGCTLDLLHKSLIDRSTAEVGR